VNLNQERKYKSLNTYLHLNIMIKKNIETKEFKMFVNKIDNSYITIVTICTKMIFDLELVLIFFNFCMS
jgi:hypothetical protein